MIIEFYLSEQEVQKAYFKQFSSRCHIWLKLLEKYSSSLESYPGTLKLVYIPNRNHVEAFFDRSNSLLNMVCEEATQLSFRDLRYTKRPKEVTAA